MFEPFCCVNPPFALPQSIDIAVCFRYGLVFTLRRTVDHKSGPTVVIHPARTIISLLWKSRQRLLLLLVLFAVLHGSKFVKSLHTQSTTNASLHVSNLIHLSSRHQQERHKIATVSHPCMSCCSKHERPGRIQVPTNQPSGTTTRVTPKLSSFSNSSRYYY